MFLFEINLETLSQELKFNHCKANHCEILYTLRFGRFIHFNVLHPVH